MSKEAVEIISGRERRRRWSVEEKLRIVHEAQAPGECVRAVAARHDVYPSLLHYWRRQVWEGRLATHWQSALFTTDTSSEPTIDRL